MNKTAYKRVLLKLSGEAFKGDRESGIDFPTVQKLAKKIANIRSMGVDVAIVNGGGNLFRGRAGTKYGMEQTSADYIGMMATVMNSIALQEALEQIDVPTRVLTAIDVKRIAEPFIRRRAIRHMEKGRVVICAAGIGNPFFTTDTAGVLRAIELGCEIMLKASNVDGVYSADPSEKGAKKFEKITYSEFLQKKLRALDATAVSLAMEKNLPIEIFNFFKEGNLEKVIAGQRIGTLIH